MKHVPGMDILCRPAACTGAGTTSGGAGAVSLPGGCGSVAGARRPTQRGPATERVCASPRQPEARYAGWAWPRRCPRPGSATTGSMSWPWPWMRWMRSGAGRWPTRPARCARAWANAGQARCQRLQSQRQLHRHRLPAPVQAQTSAQQPVFATGQPNDGVAFRTKRPGARPSRFLTTRPGAARRDARTPAAAGAGRWELARIAVQIAQQGGYGQRGGVVLRLSGRRTGHARRARWPRRSGIPAVCTSPESRSTPMCAFMPKCHWLPFFA